MTSQAVPSRELHAAVGAVLHDYLALDARDEVLITCDGGTDPLLLDALTRAAAPAPTAVLRIDRLPYQGKLADPYVPRTLSAAAQASTLWIDTTFPYLAGCDTHSEVLAAARSRYLLLGDLDAAAVTRLFTPRIMDPLFTLQTALDALFASAVGSTVRVATPAGTDVSFTIGKPSKPKVRGNAAPGTYTSPGSAVIYPAPDSVRGTIVVEAAFHEFYEPLNGPMRLDIDGEIRSVSGAAADVAVMRRALSRASAGRGLGRVIHFSHGFHPGARFGGRAFNEDIRSTGSDAVGFGVPWWEPGGGENHPDGIIRSQSLWLDGTPIAADGQLVEPALRDLERSLDARFGRGDA
ncbi:MAG: hypothetical protein AB7L76_21230 [Burkholderiaceae bacterium]